MATMLMVDTCGNTGGIAVATWNEDSPPDHGDPSLSPDVLAERTLPGRETQELLMTTLAEVLHAAAKQPGGVDVLAVVTGPGSFTGVRIGMAAVKGLAEALGKPVVAVSRLAVLVAQARSTGPVQAWISAGRGDVFVGRYLDGVCMEEAMLHGADAAAAVDPAGILVVMEDGLPEAPHPALRVRPVGVREALPLAIALARAGRFADTALLDANYLRVPDAELALRARTLAAANNEASAP